MRLWAWEPMIIDSFAHWCLVRSPQDEEIGMALFRCEQYPFLLVLDPRDPARELARFKDGLFQTNDLFTIAELSKRSYIERIDTADERAYAYRLEHRKCGKPNCKCARGQPHGPYIYAYSHAAGRTKRTYVGKA